MEKVFQYQSLDDLARNVLPQSTSTRCGPWGNDRDRGFGVFNQMGVAMASEKGLRSRFGVKAAVALIVGQGLAGMAQAAPSVDIYLGYADALRGSPNFPSIWFGDVGVNGYGGGSLIAGADTGGIMIRNTGSTAFAITSVTVNGFQDGSSYTLWNAMLAADGDGILGGEMGIFAQTADYNFDTSDTSPGFSNGFRSSAIPVVTFTFSDGSTATCRDTGQVLNTAGFDTASIGNEALGWRLCGTTGIDHPGNQIPEPVSLALVGLGLLGAAMGSRRRSAR